MARAKPIVCGADRIDGHRALFAGRRLGLVANRASVDRAMIPTWRRLAALDGATVARLFAPEHGIAGAAAAGEALEDGVDGDSGLPVTALYGPRSRPGPEHFAGLDAVVFDLPDAGCRAFTYLATLLGLCAAAADSGCPLIVLDRPNPAGGRVEGGGVAPGMENFVAPYDLPLRHGLTLGEAARLHCGETGLPEPAVVPCTGWHRRVAAPEAVWIAPSPNLPTAASALAYCGTVLIEGTALSEGRGTTRPFTLIGAPGLAGEALARDLRGRDLPGLAVRPAEFRPTASKHAGERCAGIELHIADAGRYRALPVVLAILASVRDRQGELLGAGGFLDRLAGGPELRAWCGTIGAEPAELLGHWAAAEPVFRERVAPYLLYPAAS